jgi:hypothetical protein
MFGGRLIPSTLIGAGLASVMYVIGGIAEKLGILATATAGIVGPLFGLLGFTIPIGIGLYQDYKEGKQATAAQASPAK